MRRLAVLCIWAAASLFAPLARHDAVAAPDTTGRQALLDRGIAAKAKGDFDAAVADFDRAVAADPKWGIAYEFRGATLAAKAEASDDPVAAADLLDKAIADYDNAIRLGETTARAYTLRGVASSDKAAFKRAIADFDHALKLDADFKLATRMRDFAIDQSQAQDRAIALDSDLLRFQPRNIDLLLSRADLLIHQERPDEAKRDVAKVLEIDPGNAAALGLRRALEAAAGPAQEHNP